MKSVYARITQIHTRVVDAVININSELAVIIKINFTLNQFIYHNAFYIIRMGAPHSYKNVSVKNRNNANAGNGTAIEFSSV